MLRRLLPLLALVLAAGCGGSTPADLTQQTLEQVRSGQYDEAIATGTEAIQSDPANAANYLYRGRAYHFRNAMGDRSRAIADFSEAIHLAPDSSDAYYSRALAYRDVGETDLADSDEQKARELDGVVQDVYARLPDLTPPAEVAKAASPEKQELSDKDATGAGSGRTENEREMYEKLKKRYEPGFGQLRSPSKGEDQKAADQLQEARKERYRELMAPPGATLPSESESTAGRDVLGGVDLNSRDRDEATEPGATGAGVRVPGALGGARPLTHSSEQGQPAPAIGLAPNTGLRSPFPQRSPGPTGYVEPLANPFAPRPRATTGRSSTIGRPFSTPPTTNPYSNPAVRPSNPRDYLP